MANDFEILKRIFNAFDPFRPLPAGDRAYVECQRVRGDSNIVKELGREIQLTDHKTCQLYSGHMGAGKSTELLQLVQYLKDNDFKVIYFPAEEDIDSEDVQYTEILLACTKHILKELKDADQNPILKWVQERGRSLSTLLNTDLSLDSIEVGFSDITATLKASPSTRQKIRKELEPYTVSLIEALNQVIEQGMTKHKQPIQKLVMIADSLDRIPYKFDPECGRSNYEQIFIDSSEQLKGLKCHVIYTVPISLVHSNRATDLQTIYGTGAQILPMIMVQTSANQFYEEGIQKLKELICRRIDLVMPSYAIAPDLPQIFDRRETLEQLCLMSGGHVRDLMLLMQAALKRTDTLPISVKAAQRAISEIRETYHRTVDDDQWRVLAKVWLTKKIRNDEIHRKLLFRRCVLEYRELDADDAIRPWYDVHPLIRGLQEFKDALAQIQNDSDPNRLE